MSVWENPSYAIEPLRNLANNLPRHRESEIPSYLAGVFRFEGAGDSVRHPERNGKTLYEYYREDPARWVEFFNANKRARRLSQLESSQFESTIIETNLKYVGLKAVYWAFCNITEKKWKANGKLDIEELTTFVSKAHKISGSANRHNQSDWEYYQSKIESKDAYKQEWKYQETQTDNFRFAWTLKGSQKVRKITKRNQKLYKSVFGSRVVSIETEEGISDVIGALKPRGKVLGKVKRTDADILEEYDKVRAAVRRGVAISADDARLLGLLTYKEMPKKRGRLIIFSFTGGLIFYDRKLKESGIFFEKDYDRLIQMLQCDAKLSFYFANYTPLDDGLCELMYTLYTEIRKIAISTMRKSDINSCQKICRAFDVAQFMLLADLANDINNRSSEIQRAKVDKEELDKVLDIDSVLRLFNHSALGVRESLELAKFYKIFPCPDFDIYSVVDSIEKKSVNGHKASEAAEVVNLFGVSAVATKKEFKKYMKRNRIINYYDVHKVLPGRLIINENIATPAALVGYPAISVSALTLDHMDHIDIRGTYDYVTFHGNEAALVKDKTIAPTVPRDDTRKLKDISPIERNQVLKFLFSDKFMAQGDVHAKSLDGTLWTDYKTWILLALKAEAKKPGSRAFSMATDEMRRLLSEAEFNIAQYVTKQRGSTQGKEDQLLDARLSQIASTPLPNPDYWEIMVSADLEGFSPMQDPQFKLDAFESWSEVFDNPAFNETIKIFTETTLHFEKFDISDEFRMVGNDLEGFHGRMNTAAHLDLMGYAVYKMKEIGLLTGTANMEALIDDGVMRLKVAKGSKGKRYTLEAATECIVEVISTMYDFAGQAISWDKTFVSQLVCMYLNKVFYDGIEVTPGAKAFMRIGKKLQVAVPTLSDELEAHASTARGAIQSGSDHIVTNYAMLVEVYKTYKRWGLQPVGGKQCDALAFASYIPVGLGGFSVPSMYQFSTDESFGSLQSGIANMKLICHSFPGYRDMANKYLNAGVRDLGPEAILQNPTAIRTKNRCLNRRRFANIAKATLLRKSTNTLIMAVNRGDFDHLDDAIIRTIARTTNLSEIQRSLLHKMAINSFLDGIVTKLQNSSTAATIIGKRRTLAILLANKSEARQLLNETARGMLVKRDY